LDVSDHGIEFPGRSRSESNLFRDQEIALVEGIADQIGTALERDQLTAV